MSFTFNENRNISEITQEQYYYMLGAVPPIDAKGCFAMGEPVGHEADGMTYRWAGVRTDTKGKRRFYTCFGTKPQAEAAFAEMDLLAQRRVKHKANVEAAFKAARAGKQIKLSALMCGAEQTGASALGGDAVVDNSKPLMSDNWEVRA